MLSSSRSEAPQQDFAGKTALVTGGSGALGRSFGDEWLARGANVAFTFLSHREEAEAVEALGPRERVRAFQADVRDPDAAIRVLRELPAAWDGVELLVNNAGKANDKLLMTMGVEEWRGVLETSLMGVYSFSKPVALRMARRQRGSILNVASVSALKGVAGQTNYCAAKAGLLGFTRALAVEMGRFNVRVNALLPGLMDGGLAGELSGARTGGIVAQIPLRRTGELEEAVRAGMFLLSDEASYVTGHCLAVDGGLSAT